MSKGMPSLVALLGLLAVAGYQNRDKIAGALGGLANNSGSPGSASGQPGGLLSGLGDLLNSFKSAGQEEVADSWVNPAVPTQGLTAEQVGQAIGADNLDELSRRTGLSRQELLQRLATAIPSAVDRLTPGGNMPTESEAAKLLLPDA